MKNSDIAILIIIASIRVLVAYFVADAVIGKPSHQTVTVKTIAPISAEVDTPDPTIFNKAEKTEKHENRDRSADGKRIDRNHGSYPSRTRVPIR